MNKFLNKIFFIIVLVLLTTGCKKNLSLNEKQVILFQYDHINHAWGYQHHGFIIDNQGNVLTYSNPEGWHFPDESLLISEDQVTENLSKCTHSGIMIQDEILKKYTGHIPNIASSKITAAKNVGADAGTAQFICYQFMDDSHLYKGSLVKMEGDFTKENLNFYSKKIISWMKEINDRISKQ